MGRRPLADRLRIPVYDAVDPAITSGIREQVDSSLGRQGEILDLLAGRFGPYPFSTVGAIVDPERPVLFALETQTRPVYSSTSWLDFGSGDPVNADYVLVHELAHQWFGDNVALDRWRDIWLNEPPTSSSHWPKASRAVSWTICSPPGCSRRSGPNGRPRRNASVPDG